MNTKWMYLVPMIVANVFLLLCMVGLSTIAVRDIDKFDNNIVKAHLTRIIDRSNGARNLEIVQNGKVIRRIESNLK